VREEKPRRRFMVKRAVFLSLLAAVGLQGCYYYVGPPAAVVAPAPAVSSYDMAWDNALRAAGETGIEITSADRGTGTILGRRGPTDVTITVLRQSDGRIRVEMDFRGNRSRTDRVADDFYRAYDRTMGRR
jgi:hypothetical protein